MRVNRVVLFEPAVGDAKVQAYVAAEELITVG